MKKFIKLIFVAAALAATPNTAFAQGFLKKLGKAVEKAHKTITPKESQNTVAEDNLAAMPGVEFKYVEAYHEGLGALVDFTLTNNSQNFYDITFNGTDGLDGWSKSEAVGGDGLARTCYLRAIDGNNSMDMVTRYRLMPGSTVKGSLKINKLDRAIKSLNGVSIAGLWQANEDNNNHNFRFTINGPIEVVTPMNTTQENVICTLPYACEL